MQDWWPAAGSMGRACCGRRTVASHARFPAHGPAKPALIVAHLDCRLEDRWAAVTRLDRYFPSVPVVVLDYDRPDAGRLQAWRPYRFLRKPLGVRDLVGLVDELTAPGERP